MRKHGAASRNILFLCSQIMLSQLLCLPQSGAEDTLPRPEQPSGRHTITLEFAYDGGGFGKAGSGGMSVDGRKVAEGRIQRTIPWRVSLDECFDIGEDTGTAVSRDYDANMPFKFTGTISIPASQVFLLIAYRNAPDR